MLVIKSQGFGAITNGEYYLSDCGEFRIMREYGLVRVDDGFGDDVGVQLNGRWTLRNTKTNEIIDWDRYRNDLFERNNIRLKDLNYRNPMMVK